MVPLEEVIAREFYETCERLGPQLGFEREGIFTWNEAPEKEKQLLIAIIKDMLQRGVIISV